MDEEQAKKPRPRPAPEAAPRDDVVVVTSRCPFCHEGVDPAAAAWVACSACLGRHHAACWGEAGRCAACGTTTHLQPPGARGSAAARTVWLVLSGGLLLMLGLGVALVLFQHKAPAPPPISGPVRPRPIPLPATPVAPVAPRAVPDPFEESNDRAVVARARELLKQGDLDADEALRLAALERRLASQRGDGPPESILTSESDFLFVDGTAGTAVMGRRMSANPDFKGDPGEGCLVAYGHLLLGDGAACVAAANRVLDLVPWYSVAWSLRARGKARLGDAAGAQEDAARAATMARSGNGHDRLWAASAADALRRVLASPRVQKAGVPGVVAALEARIAKLEAPR
jgi:hypothetical protein